MRLHDDVALARPGKQAGAIEHRDAAAPAGDEAPVAELLHGLAYALASCAYQACEDVLRHWKGVRSDSIDALQKRAA